MIYDLIVVGSGPIGLYAGTLGSLHGLKTLIIEGLDHVGGQLDELYPQKDIIDIPAITSIKAGTFIDRLVSQMNSLKDVPEVKTSEKVIDIVTLEDRVKVKTNHGEYEGKTTILATGMGVFTPRKIGLENEDQFKNIYYSVKNKEIFKNKKLVVLGGGDSAVDWTLALQETAKSVAIVHRRNEFRAHESNVNEMRALGIKIYTPYTVARLVGDGEKLTNIVLTNGVEEVEVKVDALLVNYGNITNPEKFGFEIEKTGYKVDHKMRINERVFACGNACYYDGKVMNITCGLGEAVIAVTEADKLINPQKTIPVHF